MELMCDICGSPDEGDHHTTTSLDFQLKSFKSHIHLCNECYKKAYAPILDQLQAIEIEIMKEIGAIDEDL